MAFVKRITVVSESGPQVIFEEKKKKRKSSRMMRPLEKATRRFLEASNELTEQALERHNRSSHKRKDGWVRDMMDNTMKANRRAMKKLTKR